MLSNMTEKMVYFSNSSANFAKNNQIEKDFSLFLMENPYKVS